jgi:hypothetical protein
MTTPTPNANANTDHVVLMVTCLSKEASSVDAVRKFLTELNAGKVGHIHMKRQYDFFSRDAKEQNKEDASTDTSVDPSGSGASADGSGNEKKTGTENKGKIKKAPKIGKNTDKYVVLTSKSVFEAFTKDSKKNDQFRVVTYDPKLQKYQYLSDVDTGFRIPMFEEIATNAGLMDAAINRLRALMSDFASFGMFEVRDYRISLDLAKNSNAVSGITVGFRQRLNLAVLLYVVSLINDSNWGFDVPNYPNALIRCTPHVVAVHQNPKKNAHSVKPVANAAKGVVKEPVSAPTGKPAKGTYGHPNNKNDYVMVPMAAMQQFMAMSQPANYTSAPQGYSQGYAQGYQSHSDARNAPAYNPNNRGGYQPRVIPNNDYQPRVIPSNDYAHGPHNHHYANNDNYRGRGRGGRGGRPQHYGNDNAPSTFERAVNHNANRNADLN